MKSSDLDIKSTILWYKDEAQKELYDILSWWSTYMPDEEQGGFYGSVSNNNQPAVAAPKGIVLNSRILWFFAAAYEQTRLPVHLRMATRAYTYITDHLIDKQAGGVFWSVDAAGNMLESRKQVYGLAFCIYAFSAFYKVTRNEETLQLALQLVQLIEQYSRDTISGGYIEAFTRDWQPIADLRLSEKDDNERKTMNTHLHIIEAYAALYQVYPDDSLKQNIVHLLEVFDQFIINKQTGHLHLFMDDYWKVKSTLQSFGHDIEAAWLLLEAAHVINEKKIVNTYEQYSLLLADAAAEGLDKDGGLWYEYEPETKLMIHEKHSWPQAEAMVGFMNAWELSGRIHYLHASIASYSFIKNQLKDGQNGEWFWGRNQDGSVMHKEKAGFWKCPYHSGRACLEVIKRANHITNKLLKQPINSTDLYFP